MALRLTFEEEAPFTIVDWPQAGRAHFMRSEAFRILARSLASYVNGDVPGRSFLIAGHRGSGKTTLVLRAIEEHRQAVLRELVTMAESLDSAGLRRHPMRRPLLVKLHGPSLLADELPRPGGGERPKPAENPSRSSAAGAPEGSSGKPAERENGKQTDPAESGKSAQASNPPAITDGPSAATAPSEIAHGALVHVAIALYRALAGEFSYTFARQVAARRDSDLLEMAAQLRLDLDQGAEPAVLRGYWDRAECLGRGVLWPQRVTEAAGLTDQGLREIIALVTAGQAFRVCAGVEKYTQTQKDSRAYEATRESKAGVDFKDLANRLAGLTVGGLVGWGVAQGAGAPPAAGAGVGAAMLGALALTWSSRRTTKRERNFDYTFIVDRSIETLDRDLPEVIDRVRGAGLAPIFVVDELDKLDDPLGTIGALIRRLKYLTTDYGFFCFLTDRNFYDAIQVQLDTSAYPREHTYFSDRLFILYRPEELSSYLRAVIVPDTPTGGSRADDIARATLAKLIVHHSKLNTVDAIRELARGWDENGAYATTSEALATQFRYQLTVSVQLAVDFLLRHPLIAGPIGQSAFAQIAVDAIYMVSRQWEAEAPNFSVGDAALLPYLAKRLKPGGRDGSAQKTATDASDPVDGATIDTVARDAALRDARATVLQVIGEAEFRLIQELVVGLAELLCSFSQLRQVLQVESWLGQEELPLIEAIPGPPVTGLLRRVPGEGHESIKYEFLYDIYGRDLNTGRLVGRSGALSPQIAEQIEDTTQIVGGMEQAVGVIGIGIPDLVESELLPRIAWEDIRQASERLVAALMVDRAYGQLAADVPLLEAFAGAVAQRGRGLDRLLRLALQIKHDAQTEKSLARVLSDMRRYIDMPGAAMGRDVGLPAEQWTQSSVFPGRESMSVSMWRLEIVGWRTSDLAQRPVPATDTLVYNAWVRWAENVLAFTANGRPGGVRISYEDLVLAVVERLPATLFHTDLSRLNARDWSRLCLLGAEWAANPRVAGSVENPYVPDGPAWTIVAGLRVLQFDRDLLVKLAEELAPSAGDATAALLAKFAGGAPRAEPGVLVVVDDTRSADQGGISTKRPSLTVERSYLTDYAAALKWLEGRGVYVGVASEGQIEDEEVRAAGVSPAPAAG